MSVLVRYGGVAHALGDIYEDIRAVEVTLHLLVQGALMQVHGADDDAWWRRGVPEGIRGKCGDRRERDEEPADHPYCYTDLVDLRDLVGKAWPTLSPVLPSQVAHDKPGLMDDLLRLNSVRRIVMHPARMQVPTKDDVDFLRELRSRLGIA